MEVNFTEPSPSVRVGAGLSNTKVSHFARRGEGGVARVECNIVPHYVYPLTASIRLA